MKAKGIDLDRKVLADMAMNEPDSFAELAKAVIS
jgi:ribosomal protein L20